jgi:hypothetical protein
MLHHDKAIQFSYGAISATRRQSDTPIWRQKGGKTLSRPWTIKTAVMQSRQGLGIFEGLNFCHQAHRD